MINIFSSDNFRRNGNWVAGRWAPLLFSPNPDCADRFVIGAVAVSESDVFVARVRADERFKCLFGDAAEMALKIQKATLDYVEKAVADLGSEIFSSSDLAFSGVRFGDIREGEAASMRELALRSLKLASILHLDLDEALKEICISDESTPGTAPINNDRLPILVYKNIEKSDQEIARHFSSQIREGKRQAAGGPQKVFIGFAGDQVVANFATLKPTRNRSLIDHIKRLMWDLSQYQMSEAATISTSRRYEMMLYRRGETDPEYDEKNDSRLDEIISDFEDQGKRDGINVRAQTSVDGIASHIRLSERPNLAVA